MKIAAALPVPVPDHAEPLRAPDIDPDAFLRLWSGLAPKALAGAASDDQRGTGGDGGDCARGAAPHDLMPAGPAGGGEQMPVPMAMPMPMPLAMATPNSPPDRRVASAEPGLAPLRTLPLPAGGRQELAETPVAPFLPDPGGSPAMPAAAQALPGGAAAPAPAAMADLPAMPAAQHGGGQERPVQAPGPLVSRGGPSVVARDFIGMAGLAAPAETPPGLAFTPGETRVPDGMAPFPDPVQKTPYFQTHAVSAPAFATTGTVVEGALEPEPASGPAGLASGQVAARQDAADAPLRRHDQPAAAMQPALAHRRDAPVLAALPPENPLPGASPGVAASADPPAGLVAALSVTGPLSAPVSDSSGKPGPDRSAGPGAAPAPGPLAGPGPSAQPPIPVPGRDGGEVPQPPGRLSDGAGRTLPATPLSWPGLQAAPNMPAVGLARAADTPDTWSLVLARVAGLHARRPPADPQTAPLPPAAPGVGAVLPDAVRVLPDEPGAPPPDRPAPPSGPGIAAPLPAPPLLAGGPDAMPDPLAGSEKSASPLQAADLLPMAAIPDSPASRSEERRPALPADPPPPRQIAEAVRNASGNRVDLTLMPEELGRVTISFRDDGDMLRVHLTADRPETLDLLRRHAPELAAELRSQGYDAPSFFFGRSARHPSGYAMGGAAPDAEAPAAADPAPPVPRPAAAEGTGTLDLRL